MGGKSWFASIAKQPRKYSEPRTLPQLWVVAGPNGAGKTTLVSRRLARSITVVNPDVIAQELPRVDGELDERQAGEIAIDRRRSFLAQGADFAVETTLTGNSALRLIRLARQAGYKVTLVYVGIGSADASMDRVLLRVSRGGHPVGVEDIYRRYPASLRNLAIALSLVDRAFVFDNSSLKRRKLLSRERGKSLSCCGPSRMGR